MKRPWGPAPLQLDRSALSGESRGHTQASTSRGEGKQTQSQRGADFHRQKSPPLGPDWSDLMQMRTPNPHSLIGPKRTVLIGQNGAALIGQSCVSLIGWRKPKSYWLKQDPRGSSLRVRPIGPSAGRQLSAGCSVSVGCVRGPCAEMAVRLCFLMFEPHGPPAALLSWRLLLLRVHAHLRCLWVS